MYDIYVAQDIEGALHGLLKAGCTVVEVQYVSWRCSAGLFCMCVTSEGGNIRCFPNQETVRLSNFRFSRVIYQMHVSSDGLLIRRNWKIMTLRRTYIYNMVIYTHTCILFDHVLQ